MAVPKFVDSITLPDYLKMRGHRRRLFERRFCLSLIRREFGDGEAEKAAVDDVDTLLMRATGTQDPGVGRTVLMKIFEAKAAEDIPGWERRYH